MLEIFKVPGQDDQSLSKLNTIIRAIQQQRYLPQKVRQDAIKVLETMRWIRVNQAELALFIDSKEKYLKLLPIRDRENQVVRDHFGTSLHFNAYKKGDGAVAVNTLVTIIEFFERECLALIDTKKNIQFSNLILQFNYDKSRGCFEARVAKAKMYLVQLQSLPEGVDQLEDILQVFMHTRFNQYSLYNYLIADQALSTKYGALMIYAGKQSIFTQEMLFSAMQELLAFDEVSAEALQQARARSQHQPQAWHQEVFRELIKNTTVKQDDTKGHQYLFAQETEACDLLKWFGQALSTSTLHFGTLQHSKVGEQFSVTLSESQWKYLTVMPVPEAKPETSKPSTAITPDASSIPPVSRRSRLSRWTPLHEAASFGNHETVRELILVGENLAAIDGNDVVPIEVAARFSHWQCVRTIAENKQETAEGSYRYGRALLLAAQERQTDVVVALAQAEAKLTEICPEKNRTALHWAAHHGDVAALEALLKAGADLAACDLEKLTPIEVAAKAKQWQCVKAISSHTKEVADQKYHFGAALLHAVYADQLDLVKDLVSAEARISWSFPTTKQTALHLALIKPDKTLLEILLQSKHLSITQDKDGATPIKLAFDKHDWEMVTTLATKMPANKLYSYEYGSILIDAAISGKTEAVIALAKANADLTMLEQDKKWTVLHRMAHEGHIACVKALIEAGADLAAKDAELKTPLQLAAERKHWNCVTAIANLKKEASDGSYKYGEVLLSAVLESRKEAIEALVAAGAGMSAVTLKQGFTVLHIAIRTKKHSLLGTLLKSPHAVLLADVNGLTPIGWAQESSMWPMVAAIADRQLSSKEAAGEYGSILVERAKNKDVDAVLKLIKVGADLSKVTASDQRTALHWMVAHNELGGVAALIQAGADLAAIDTNKQTPMRLAIKLEHWSCVETMAQLKSECDKSSYDYGFALLLATAKRQTAALAALVKANAPMTWVTTENNSMKLPAQQTALHIAVEHQDLSLLKILLSSKRVTMAKDVNDLTPIQLAAQKCLWNFVVELAEKFHESADQKYEYEKILLDATAKNETTAALALLKSGANPSYADIKDQKTPLHWAVSNSNKMLVNALLVSKSDSQLTDIHQYTPLARALDSYQHEIIELLLAHKIDTKACGIKNKLTALHWAASRGEAKWINALLQAQASLSVQDQWGMTPIKIASTMDQWASVKLIAENKPETQAGDYQYAKVLLSAIVQNKTDAAIALIKAGAHIETEVDLHKNNAFHLAVQSNNEKIIRALLASKYFTEKIVYEIKNSDGATPLELSVSHKKWLSAKLIIDKAQNPGNYAQLFGQTLAKAAVDNQLELVQLLIARKAPLNHATTISNLTALHAAVINKNDEMLVALIKAGADLNMTDSAGRNPIQTAADNHDWEMVRKIHAISKKEFKYESDLLNTIIKNKTLKLFNHWRLVTDLPWYFTAELMTAIHWAAYHGNIAVCQFLLDRGADPLIKDKKGRNAIRVAIQQQHIECALFLIKEVTFQGITPSDLTDLNIAVIVVRINHAIKYKDASELELYEQLINDYLNKIPTSEPSATYKQKKGLILSLAGYVRSARGNMHEVSVLPCISLQSFLSNRYCYLEDIYEPFVDSLIQSNQQNYRNISNIEAAYYRFLSDDIPAYRLGNYLKLIKLSLSSGIAIHEFYRLSAHVDKLIFSHSGVYKNFCGWQPQAWSGFLNQLKNPKTRAALRCPRSGAQNLYKYYHLSNSIAQYKKGSKVKSHHDTHAKKQSVTLLSPHINTIFFGNQRLRVGVLMEVDTNLGAQYHHAKVKIKAMFIQDVGTYGRAWVDTQQNLQDYAARIQPLMAKSLHDLRERTLDLERCNEILGEPSKESIRAVVVGRLEEKEIETAKRYQQELKAQLGLSVPIALYDYTKQIFIPNIAPLIEQRERLQALFAEYRRNRYKISREVIQLEQAMNGDYLTLGDRIRDLFVTEQFLEKDGRLFSPLENKSIFARHNTDHVMREVRKEFNL